MAEIMAVLGAGRSRFSMAAAMSLASAMQYLLKTERVFHPPMSMIVDSATPARRNSRAADLLKSWQMNPT